jgi:host factor-I protein
MSDGRPAPQNIQDAFLNTVRRDKATVMVYLVNGAKLSGRIRSFDKFSVLLESGPHEQLIFKHAISTISLTKRTSGELRAAALADDASAQSNHPDNQPADSPES